MSPIIKINKHIEIVRATTPGLSSLSSASARALQVLLKKHYASVEIVIVNTDIDAAAVLSRKPDLVFSGVKYVLAQGRKISRVWLSEYLEANGITVTGSTKSAHILELDKYLAKQRVLDNNLNTSGYCIARYGQYFDGTDLTLEYPLFVKPTSKGGGVGIDDNSVVHNNEQLLAKIRSISEKYRADSLIEEYLPGREFSVAVLRDLDGIYRAMPLELVAPLNGRGDRVLSSAVKAADAECFLPVEDERIRTDICQLALDVFMVLGARDYGRIDIRMDRYGVSQFLEANLIPSLIENYGNFPKACMLNAGMDYEEVILRIVDLAMARSTVADQKNDLLTNVLTPYVAAVSY